MAHIARPLLEDHAIDAGRDLANDGACLSRRSFVGLLLPAAASGRPIGATSSAPMNSASTCPTVGVLEVRLVVPHLSLSLLADLDPGIHMASASDLAFIEFLKSTNRAALAGDIALRRVNVQSRHITAYAIGPRIAAEDRLELPRVHCTGRGVAISSRIQLAIPLGASSYRRVVWRPVLAIRLDLHAPDSRLEVAWSIREPGGEKSSSVASVKDIRRDPGKH